MALDGNPTYSVTPSSVKSIMSSNYISLYDYSSVYKPDVAEKIKNIYGKQSITGMLTYLADESSYGSDLYYWSEEGRLHTVYNDVARSGSVFTKANHVFRVGETVSVSDGTYKRRGRITAADTNTFTMVAYKSVGFTALGTTDLTAFVDGSEFKKGTEGMEGSLEKDVTTRQNKGIILKNQYGVNGSDMTAVSWITHENGGNLWYLTSQLQSRKQFEDKLELAMLVGNLAEAGSDADNAGYGGTEGLFEAVQKRGNTYSGVIDDLDDWDTIIKRLDKQGKIQDYTFYVDRDQSLAIDNLLGGLNAGHSTGISYGIFNNSADMSVNLGFQGFQRGTYNFFKTDWALLNDPTLLGAVDEAADKIRGILIPVGTEEVYEGQHHGTASAGDKISVPFLEQKYRIKGTENRKYKTNVVGGAGGINTSSLDGVEFHELSERMLCTTGANNFVLFEGS